MRSYRIIEKLMRGSELGSYINKLKINTTTTTTMATTIQQTIRAKRIYGVGGGIVTWQSANLYLSTHFYSTQQNTFERVEVACVINPHPAKRGTGGEDGYYIGEGGESFGVADGVGGWASHGVDAGVYAKRLMALVKAEEEKAANRGRSSLTASIGAAHKQISKEHLEGSTTLCLVKIIEKSLHSYVLGDSSYMLLYDDLQRFYKSEEQQKSFNFPYQLGSEGDRVSDGRQRVHPLAEGDVIIVGTDGIFDNLSEEYIHSLVLADRDKSAMEIASRIVNEATLVAFNRHPMKELHVTPFQINSRGYFKGGKLDDMALIVARIRKL